MGRLFESHFWPIPEPDFGAPRSIMHNGLQAVIRCTSHQWPLWSVGVPLEPLDLPCEQSVTDGDLMSPPRPVRGCAGSGGAFPPDGWEIGECQS